MSRPIPKMDYIITGKNCSTMLEEVVAGIKRQSNVKRIIFSAPKDLDEATNRLAHFMLYLGTIDELHFVEGSMVATKVAAVKEATGRYVVLLDDDVVLPNGWIEQLWPEMKKNVGSVYSIVVFDKYLKAWFKRKAKRREEYKWARMQNTLVRRYILLDMPDFYNLNGIDPDIIFTKWIVKKGYKNILLPIVIDHASDCHASDFKEGIRGGARLRRMGFYKSFHSVIKYGINNILGGLRASFVMRTPYFIVAPVKKTLGMIVGYFAWNKYYIKYDFSCKK